MRASLSSVTRWAALLGAVMILAACSESRETRAANACVKELEAKIEKGRPYSADIPKIAAAAKSDSAAADIIDIESEATLDAGQANEQAQKFTCRVQFDAAKPDAEPAVILFQFVY